MSTSSEASSNSRLEPPPMPGYPRPPRPEAPRSALEGPAPSPSRGRSRMRKRGYELDHPSRCDATHRSSGGGGGVQRRSEAPAWEPMPDASASPAVHESLSRADVERRRADPSPDGGHQQVL